MWMWWINDVNRVKRKKEKEKKNCIANITVNLELEPYNFNFLVNFSLMLMKIWNNKLKNRIIFHTYTCLPTDIGTHNAMKSYIISIWLGCHGVLKFLIWFLLRTACENNAISILTVWLFFSYVVEFLFNSRITKIFSWLPQRFFFLFLISRTLSCVLRRYVWLFFNDRWYNKCIGENIHNFHNKKSESETKKYRFKSLMQILIANIYFIDS